MVFSGKYGITSEKRHAKVLILRKEQTFSCFFFKKLRLENEMGERFTSARGQPTPAVQQTVQSNVGLW